MKSTFFNRCRRIAGTYWMVAKKKKTKNNENASANDAVCLSLTVTISFRAKFFGHRENDYVLA